MLQGEVFFQQEIAQFVDGRRPEYMRTAAVEMKYEEVVQQTEAAEAAQAALHTKLDTVLTNLKKQLVAGCFEAAVEEAAVVCAEALEEQAVGREH